MKTKNTEHTHFWIWSVILVLVIQIIYSSFITSNLQNQMDSKQDKVYTEVIPKSDSAKVVFEFNDSYFSFFYSGESISRYNNTIELNTWDSKNFDYFLYNPENFTTLCVEYAIKNVEFNIFIYSLDRVETPYEYTTNYGYQVYCYKLPNVEEIESQVMLTQKFEDVEDSIIKFTLWKNV